MDTNYIGLAAVLLGGLTVLTPVVAFSVRFAIRPVVEGMVRLREAQQADRTDQLQDRRMAVLEAEVQSLQHTVRNLVEAESFNRELASSRNPASLPSSAAAQQAEA
jgi:hypothetical protein